MRIAPLAVLLLLVASGCISSPPAPEPETSDEPLPVAAERPVVVAVIDSGVNLYHDTYQRPAGLSDTALSTFVNTLDGAAPERIALTRTGDHGARVATDAAVWAGMAEHTLYYFEGTNVLGISFDTGDDHPVLDDGSHGTGTTGAVLAVDPGLVIVLVEGIGPDAEAWAANQPWIDAVSMSYGPPGSGPKAGTLFGLTTSEATRLMWENGKLPLGAADNSAALATFDETAGPPWVIGIAGDRSEQGCRVTNSGTFADFTSDFTQDLPRSDSVDENRSMSGTSFATPKSAGSFGMALRMLRDAYGAPPANASDGVLAYGPDNATVTNGDLRSAFEQAARYLAPDPMCREGTVNPAAPWVQQGWGHIGPEMVPDAVAVITGDGDVPEKPEQAKEWNESLMTLRRLYWENA